MCGSQSVFLLLLFLNIFERVFFSENYMNVLETDYTKTNALDYSQSYVRLGFLLLIKKINKLQCLVDTRLILNYKDGLQTVPYSN